MDFLHLTLHRAPVAEMATVHWIVHTPSLHFPVSLAIRLGYVTCCSQSKWGYCVSLPGQEAIYFLYPFCSLPWQSWRPCVPEDYKVKDGHQKIKKEVDLLNLKFYVLIRNVKLPFTKIIHHIFPETMLESSCFLHPPHRGRSQRIVNHFLFVSCYIWTLSAFPGLACWMMWNSSSWWQSKPELLNWPRELGGIINVWYFNH